MILLLNTLSICIVSQFSEINFRFESNRSRTLSERGFKKQHDVKTRYDDRRFSGGYVEIGI